MNGRLEIVVQDPSGAAVVNAKVTIKDLRRDAVLTSSRQTDETGAALFPSMAPSEYQITAEAAGFRQSIVSGIELNASQTIRQVINLEVGQVSESIAVEANAVAVNVSDATIARTVNLRSIENLPQLGRSPLSLVAFVPGASVDPSDPTFTRINGARQGSNNSRLDGIDVNDAVVPRLGLSMTAVNTDSLEEVRIITNGGKAEYGRNAGGQVEMVTRSGGNQYHGAAFNFLRNTVLNANNWFNNASVNPTPRPKFIQNIFGGQVGGKIIRDKLFFFGNFQGRRTIQETIRNRTVLSAEAKQGIFRWAGGTFNIPANDPLGRGIDPKMRELMALMPNPNNSDVGDGFNTGGFRFNVSTPSKEYQGTGKLDYVVGPNHRVFFRFSRQFNESIDALNNAEQRYPGLPDGAQGGTRWGWGAGSDWTITPWMINEFRVGRQSALVDFIRPYRANGIAVLSNLYTDPINNALGQGRNSPVVDLTDNVTMLRGKHTYKAGFSFRRVLQYGYNFGGIYPDVNLTRTAAGNAVPATVGPTGLTTAQRQNFDGLFNDVLGRVGTVSQTFYSDLSAFQDAGSPRVRNTVFKDLGIFFQDDWKIKPNFTLNIGIRWENFGVPKELNGFQGSLDRINDLNTVANINNLVIRRADKWYDNDFNNFAPRFGFAWDVFKTGKTVVRGNWGMFYDRIIGATSSLVDGNTPGFAQAIQTFPSSTAPRTVSQLSASDLPAKPASVVTQLPLTRNQSIVVFNPNLRTGYLQQINFGVGHQLSSRTTLDAGFVRTLGTKLFGWQDINQPRIYGDFLNSFRELEAFRANGAAVSPGNTLARIFGGAQAAVNALGAINFQQGLAGTVADNLDRTAANFNRYAAAGVSDFYLRNYPQFNQVIRGDNIGTSSFNSLQLTLSHRTKNALAIVNYTFSKSIDNMSVDGNGFTAPVDNYNFVNNRGRGDFDRPHALNFSGSYNLPFGRNQRFLNSANGFVNRLIGDWAVSTLGVFQSGTVFSVTSGRRTLGSTLNTYANYSGDRTIGEVVKVGNGVQYFTAEQIARFTFPGPGEIGNSGRNAFRGPRFISMDCSIVKPIPVTERFKAQFRAEMYNMWNHANFTTPGTSIVTPATFGRLSATANTSSGTGARVMQMALRVDF